MIMGFIYEGVAYTGFLLGDFDDNPLDKTFNLVLFSDVVIYSNKLYYIISIIVVCIITFIVVRFLVKATYNFVKRVFGVFRI